MLLVRRWLDRGPVRPLTGLLALALAACGGSGSGKPRVLVLTSTLGAEASIEGTRDGPGNILEVTGGLDVGDREANPLTAQKGPVKSFLSFDLSPIPANATITAATLRLYLVTVQGSPITALGNVVADMLNYGGAFPDAFSYVGNNILGNLAQAASSTALGVHTCSVTFGVTQARVLNLGRFQLRLRFANADQNFDGQDTRMEFEDAENSLGSSQVPQLIVTYEIPN